jgi:hypothetical protein
MMTKLSALEEKFPSGDQYSVGEKL